MLSTNTRQRVEFLCSRIAKGAEVDLNDLIFLQKLADRNTTVASWLRKARRVAVNGDRPQDSLDEFMNALDIGEPDPSDHLSGPQDPDSLADWFTRKRKWFRGDG